MNIDRWFMPYLSASSSLVPEKVEQKQKPQTLIGQATSLVRTVSRLALNCITNSVAVCSLGSTTPTLSPQTSPKEQKQDGSSLLLLQSCIQNPLRSSADEKSEEKDFIIGKNNCISRVYQEALGKTFYSNNDLYAKILKEMYARKKCFDLQDLPQTLVAQFCQNGPTITELDLTDLPLSAKDLMFLVVNTLGLQKLAFSAEQFTDQHMVPLSYFPCLDTLKLYEAKQFNISHFQAMMELKQLRSITLKKSLLCNSEFGYLLPTEKAHYAIKKILKEHSALLFVSCDDIDIKHVNAEYE